MIKTRIIKVASIENEEIILAIRMTKIIMLNSNYRKIIIIILMFLRIKTGNCMKI